MGTYSSPTRAKLTLRHLKRGVEGGLVEAFKESIRSGGQTCDLCSVALPVIDAADDEECTIIAVVDGDSVPAFKAASGIQIEDEDVTSNTLWKHFISPCSSAIIDLCETGAIRLHLYHPSLV